MQVAEEAAALDLDDLFERETPQASGSGGRWSGWLFFGNTRTDVLDGDPPTGELLVVDLTDGTYRFADWDDADWDDATEQVFWVADRFEDDEDPPNVTYALNSHTIGDIHARIS